MTYRKTTRKITKDEYLFSTLNRYVPRAMQNRFAMGRWASSGRPFSADRNGV